MGSGYIEEKIQDRQERSRIKLEKDRLLQGYVRLYKAYDPREDKPFDISELMHEQYVTRIQAKQWENIESDASLDELERVLQRCVKKVPELERVRSIVDNGPGSGKKSALAYNFFNKSKNDEKGNLHLLDLSCEIIKGAKDYCMGVEINNIPFYNPVFFQDLGKMLTEIAKDDKYKLHLFTGQTIGNFRNPVEILRNISSNARKGEYLLLGWFCKGPEAYNEPEFKDLYRILLEELGYPREAFGDYKPRQETDSEGREWNVMTFTVQNVLEEQRTSQLLDKKHLLGQDEKYRRKHILRPGTEIIVSRSRRFKEEEVVELCKKAGLEAVVFEEWNENTWDGEGVSPETFTRRWTAYEDRRYGLFKKIGEHDPHRLKRRIFYSLAAAAGIALGGIYFSQDMSLRCENSVMQDQDHKLICEVEGKSMQFPFESIDDITMIEQSSDRIEVMLSKDKAKYKAEIRGREQVSSFAKSWEAKQEIRGMLSERNRAPCRGIRWVYDEARDTLQFFHNVLKHIAHCTGSERAVFRTMALMGYFEGVDLQHILANLLKDAYETRNGDTVADAASFFSNPRIIQVLHTIQTTNPVAVLGQDTLDVPLPRWYKSEPPISKHTSISDEVVDFLHHAHHSPNENTTEAGIDLIEYYSSHPAQMYSNFPTVWSLMGIGEAVGDDVYSSITRLANAVRDLKYHYYLFLFIEDQARRISEENNAPTAQERFYNDKRSTLIWRSIDGLNSIPKELLPVLIPPLLEYFPRLDEGTFPSGLNFLYFYSSIFGQKCVQENVRRLCFDGMGKRNETAECLRYFQRVLDIIPTIVSGSKVLEESFPYKFNLCTK